jgi:hypothetical protein
MIYSRRQKRLKQEPLPSSRLALRLGSAKGLCNAQALNLIPEDRNMRPLTEAKRCVRKSISSVAVAAAIIVVAATEGFAATPIPETIQATYSQAGNPVSVTLIVYNYSTPSDLQLLSQAFREGQDQELAAALSNTKAVGRCRIAGGLSYDVAFIQLVLTPTGRQVIFVASRPHPPDESDPAASTQRFDLAIGQFDLNDTDPTKSTGFLYPASKLVVNEQGESRYNLAGNPWALENVLDSGRTPPLTEPSVADANGPDLGKDHSPVSGH